MNAAIILIAMTAPGIDYGFEPLEDGGYEYTLQIEPQWLERLQAGEEATSYIPSWLHIRRYRVIVGNDKNLAKVKAPLASPDTLSTDEDGSARKGRDADHDSRKLSTKSLAAGPIDEETPGPLNPDPESGPLAGKKVRFDKESDEQPETKQKSKPSESRTAAARQKSAAPAEEPQPWMPFVLTLFGLAISLGGNAYLGWIAWGQRSRYWQMIEKLRVAPN